MAQKKKQLVAEGKLDKHGRPNENTPKEYLRSLPDVAASKVACSLYLTATCLVMLCVMLCLLSHVLSHALSSALMHHSRDADDMHA